MSSTDAKINLVLALVQLMPEVLSAAQTVANWDPGKAYTSEELRDLVARAIANNEELQAD